MGQIVNMDQIGKRKKTQAIITWSPAHANAVKSSGITVSGDSVTAEANGGFIRIDITDENNGVSIHTTQFLNSVTVAAVTIIEEQKETLHVN